MRRSHASAWVYATVCICRYMFFIYIRCTPFPFHHSFSESVFGCEVITRAMRVPGYLCMSTFLFVDIHPLHTRCILFPFRRCVFRCVVTPGVMRVPGLCMSEFVFVHIYSVYSR